MPWRQTECSQTRSSVRTIVVHGLDAQGCLVLQFRRLIRHNIPSMLISGQFGWSKIICSRNRSVHSSFVFACFVTRWNIGRALFGIVVLAARALFTTFSIMPKLPLPNDVEQNISDLPIYVQVACAHAVDLAATFSCWATNYSSCVWKCKVTFEPHSVR